MWAVQLARQTCGGEGRSKGYQSVVTRERAVKSKGDGDDFRVKTRAEVLWWGCLMYMRGGDNVDEGRGGGRRLRWSRFGFAEVMVGGEGGGKAVELWRGRNEVLVLDLMLMRAY